MHDDKGADFPNVEAIHDTGRAIQVRLGGPNGIRKWVPHSVIHDDSEVYEKGHKGKLVLKYWWAEKNGWLK